MDEEERLFWCAAFVARVASGSFEVNPKTTVADATSVADLALEAKREASEAWLEKAR